MREKEIMSVLGRKEFDAALRRMTRRFGRPEKIRRLALHLSDFSRKNLNTRIRITNGSPELIQKVGDWRGELKEEVIVPLPRRAEDVFNIHQIMLRSIDSPHTATAIMRFENFVFDAGKFELKFTVQTGKRSRAHSFEIEVHSHALDPREIARELGLPVREPKETPAFWKAWNRRMGLDAKRISGRKLLAMIREYLA